MATQKIPNPTEKFPTKKELKICLKQAGIDWEILPWFLQVSC